MFRPTIKQRGESRNRSTFQPSSTDGVVLQCDLLPSLAFFYDSYVSFQVLLTAAGNECLRLYLGYIGNLSDKVPELAGFWLLSLVPQLPLQLFLLLNQNIMLQPLEQIVQSLSVLLLIIQLLTGFFALRHSSKVHAEQSRLRILLWTQQKDD
ncbi:transmembrane protein 17-like isoform X3 [Schistocerca nitens]|uniref:transmembrane protein 17-like isoform X3 n=1 Tax=Schistocerca nitens TaxID=7011 RepID=UPI0021179B08|nr:transmembrane protein 17-like isoform X3 [Schistocerca nitens]